MTNPQLLEYVRVQRANGLSKEAIIQALSAGGWTAADVNEAMMAIDGVTTPPPPPPPPASVPMQPRTIIPPPGAVPVVMTPIGAATQASQAPASRPVVAASEFSTASVKKSGMSWFFMILIIIVLLVIGGGVAVAVLNPSLLGSFINMEMFFPAPTPPDPFLENTSSSTQPIIEIDTSASSSTTTSTPTTTPPFATSTKH